MEDILDLYALAYNPQQPVVCLDEKGKELRLSQRESLPMEPGQPLREDCEYAREGSCNLFVMYEPHQGYRRVWPTERRCGRDIGAVFKAIVDEEYPAAEKVRVVCDNLNIHVTGSLYECYPPEEARRIASKLEFHYTPTHASWLNMVEIELGILDRECLKGRKGSLEEVARQVAAWEAERNSKRARISWQFTTAKARQKFHRFYPKLE